jgi:hypothetical protein
MANSLNDGRYFHEVGAGAGDDVDLHRR